MAIDILKLIESETQIPYKKIENTVQLLDMGNTVPFIARYRKEVTGELDEVLIREIEEKLQFYRKLEERKKTILNSIDEQGKLTEELKDRIISVSKLTELEDLYLPYRPKRKTRASMAREKGLEPLAMYLLSAPGEGNPEKEAEKYLTEQVLEIKDALQGAMDIVAEIIGEDAEVRKWLRVYTYNNGYLHVKARDPEKDSVYRMYYEDYHEAVNKIVPHRILAVNRGEREEFLNVSLEVNEEAVHNWLYRRFVKEGVSSELLRKAADDAYQRLLAPAIERDVRRQLGERAEIHAINIFAKNLRSLLLQPPVPGKTMLGVDPAYRTGCKWAVVDKTGKLLEIGVVYPTPPQKKIEEANKEFSRLVEQYHIDAIVIGNGTASRETEQFVAEFIGDYGKKELAYTFTSEAGASVYSASPLAAREFPDLDLTQRSAVSIARRVQDPLAELVKIPPQAAGVGQYQHDISEKKLEEKLSSVVESVVNYVGVDVNTASASLLSYIAGINNSVAANIVKYREEIGEFKDRQELKKVAKLGPKTFEQCAGFLRISGGKNLLDTSSIHPESYKLTARLLEKEGLKINDLASLEFKELIRSLSKRPEEIESIAAEIDAGLPTLKDIVENLLKPGRDPREDIPPVIFRRDILGIEDLKTGMQITGTVRNVIDFGAFVDIGVKQDGLIHISELTDKFVKHPLDVVSIGDVVNVQILSVDKERGRIALSMKNVSQKEITS